jgi:hypothetical protein
MAVSFFLFCELCREALCIEQALVLAISTYIEFIYNYTVGLTQI